MSEPCIEAIILDFGGVFTRSEVTEALLERFDTQLGWQKGSMRAHLHSGETWELASTGKISSAEYWQLVGAHLEDRLPSEFRIFQRGVFRAEPIDPDMVALAEKLRRSFRLALCSNSMLDLPEILDEHPDVRRLFEVVVISAVVGYRKPDPAILRITAERLRLRPEACLLVDDKERNTRVAEALGMQAIVYRSPAQLSEELRRRGWAPSES